jgi:hypothetical protein
LASNSDKVPTRNVTSTTRMPRSAKNKNNY